jgi:hypothetical protein
MDSFSGDYYGHRCSSGRKLGDIFNDYLDLLDGVACAEDELNWQLNHNATAAEFESWERHMLQGLYRCATYSHNMDDSTRLILADRCVDIKLHNWWQKALWEKHGRQYQEKHMDRSHAHRRGDRLPLGEDRRRLLDRGARDRVARA